MMKHTLLRAAAALTITSVFTACGDGASAPTDAGVSASVTAATTVDVATMSGDAAKEDVETFKANRGAFGIAQLADFERFARWEPCPYDATAKRFVCVSRSKGPFTNTRSYAYFDATGSAQTAYDANTTASANFRWSLSGDITKEKWSGSMNRERNITITGLAGSNNTITINGTGAAERQRTRFSKSSTTSTEVERAYDMSGSVTIKDVVTPAVRLPDSYPSSGTITRTHLVTRTDADGTKTTSRTSVVTFNGTQFVPLVVNGVEFTLDLSTGVVTKKTA